mgnify:CR=1 FL=1
MMGATSGLEKSVKCTAAIATQFLIAKFGADALRLYVMFVAPPEKEVEWTDTGLEGAFRFLARVWRMADHVIPAIRLAPSPASLACDADERAMRRKTHATIQRVSSDIDPRMHLNTAISALMELVNELYAFADRRAIRPTGREDEPVAVVIPVQRRGALPSAVLPVPSVNNLSRAALLPTSRSFTRLA